MSAREDKSKQCLIAAFDAFSRGEVVSARRCLNITFSHATNADWSIADTIKILQYLAWLYYAEGRFAKAASVLEQAVTVILDDQHNHSSQLGFLHYNLAELYLRGGQIDVSKRGFLNALDSIRESLGIESTSFKLVRHRYLQVFQNDDLMSSGSLGIASIDTNLSGKASVHALAKRALA
jgi:tetratricopeptide (TPR) repeat protein